jgi:UDP-N-acetylglucosamine--N-acetylmuramyl-(pentapeptide) pyrophosphoryl-undecaprenol N-acetylglucosamine transferase
MHVVFAAGGTAGHLEPALTTADALIALDSSTQVSFIGGSRGLERDLVAPRGFPLVQTQAQPLPRKIGPTAAAFPFDTVGSIRQARAHLRSARADVVVGFGGYAAIPGYLAAWTTRTPLIIHEANSRAGFANVLGAKLTPYVATVHPHAIGHARRMALPLRASIAHLDRRAQRDAARAQWGVPADSPVLLVFGGSQGARRLNDAVAGSLATLAEHGVTVIHVVGKNNELPPERPGYHPVPYADRMDLAYAAADLAVCRSGAMTCAELTAVGLPAIYVPLPIGNGEQAGNSRPIVEAGGGLQCLDQDMTAEWLTSTVPPLVHDEVRLREMSLSAASLGDRHADRELAKWIEEVAGQRRKG